MKLRSINWRTRKRLRRVIQGSISHLFLIAGSFFFILPFLWLLSTSLKPDHQVFVFPPVWMPNPIKWVNYPKAVNYIPFFVYLRNTFVICVVSSIGAVLSCSLSAYGFSRIRWPGRDVLFTVMLSTMMVPFQVRMIPLFLTFRRLGLVNTYGPLTIPAFFGVAFFIFLLRQFFMTIPLELSDAAKVDGCSESGIYWRIILPLAKPALAVVALFQFIGSWHDFLGPLIYLNRRSMFTLSLGLRQFQTEHGAEWTFLMAASTLTILPIIILFFLTQKTFIQGITLTGLKG
jgi:ABC-type glycerol-3-phosphate transport system permease component